MGSDKFSEWARPIVEAKHGLTRTELMQSAWADIGASGYKYRIEVLKARKVIAAVGVGRFNRWTIPSRVEEVRALMAAEHRRCQRKSKEATAERIRRNYYARKLREAGDTATEDWDNRPFRHAAVSATEARPLCKAGPASIWEAAAWLR